jgi:PAS domain-containing protein
LVVVTKEHQVSYSNTAAKARVRLVRGDSLESAAHSLVLTELVSAFEKMCARPHEIIAPFDVRHRDGSIFICNMEPVLEDGYAKCILTLLLCPLTACSRLTAVAIYLYPRRATAPELVDIDKLYGPMLDALKQPVLAVDNNGHIMHINSAARAQLGFSIAELRGIDVGKVMFGVDGDCTYNNTREEEIVKHTLAGAGEWSGYVSTRSRYSGELQRSLMCATPLRSPDGSVIGSVRALEPLPSDVRPLKVRDTFDVPISLT